MKTALSYSHRALALAPQQIHFQFNIAFVQIQLAQLIHILPESQRTLDDVVKASEGLEEAIECFGVIAQSKNPPYPRHDIEQRANMGRNTMRRQLERAVQNQTEYEEKNAAKLQEARELRDAEIQRREQEKRRVEEQKEAEKQKIREERDKMAQLSRELAEKRMEEEKRREEAEYTTDEEGERVKRTKKKKGGKRKKKVDDSDTGTEAGDGGEDKAVKKTRRKKKAQSTEPSSAVGSSNEEGVTKSKKKRKRLARRGGKDDKFKSQEMVVDSDLEDDWQAAAQLTNGQASNDEDGDIQMRDGEDEEGETITRQKPRNRIIEDDDEDEDDEEDEQPSNKTTAEVDAEENGGHKGASFADNPYGDPVDDSVGAAGDAGAKELAMSEAPTVMS